MAVSARRTVYTNTTARALITAAAVTPEKRDEALTAATVYLHKDTTLAARQKALASTTFAGAYFSPVLRYLKSLYIITTAKVNTADGTNQKRFVLQGANDGRTLQPESAPLDIVANVVFLVEVGTTPLPSLWAANAGVPFKRADLAHIPAIQALIPDEEEDQEYQNVVGPRSVPLFFGGEESCRGPIDYTSAALLDAGLPGLSLWASWMSEWSQAYQEAVLASYTTDPKTLGDKFPTIKRHSKPFAPLALATTESVYNDSRDADQVLDGLRRRLFAVVPAARPPPTNEITTDPEDEPAETQPPAPGAPRPLGAAKMGTIPRKSTYGDFSESEQAATKFLLCNLIYDEATGTVRVPALREDMDYLFYFYTLTSSSKKADQLEDVLQGHIESCDGDVDFLRRLFEPPAFDRAAKALLVNGLLANGPMLDFNSSTSPKDKFRVFMLAADNAATLRLRKAARDDRELEELCGEDTANLSKVNVTITQHNTQILAIDPFLVLLANRCGLVEATVVVNLQQWDDVSNPMCYKFARELALALTNHAARQWLKVTPYSTQRRFFGWLVQMLDMYECFLAQVPANSRNVFHALTSKFSKISVEPVRRAETLKAEVLT